MNDFQKHVRRYCGVLTLPELKELKYQMADGSVKSYDEALPIYGQIVGVGAVERDTSDVERGPTQQSVQNQKNDSSDKLYGKVEKEESPRFSVRKDKE